MPTTTVKIKAFLGASGLAAQVAVYAYDGTTVVVARGAGGVSEMLSTGNYQKELVGVISFDTEYNVIWDDGAGRFLPVSTLYIPSGFNLTSINGVAVRNGNGTAAGIASGSITLDSTDPALSANLSGWTVEILSATTGAGQVATISSTTTSGTKPVTPSWPITPTGTIVYALHYPVAAVGGGDTSGTTTLLGRLSATRAGYLDNLSAGAVAQAAALTAVDSKLGTPAASVSADIAAVPAAAATSVFAKAGQLGDGSKTFAQTMTKAVARLFGKIDTVTAPGSAIFRKLDDSGEAFREPFGGTPARGNHTPGSGL